MYKYHKNLHPPIYDQLFTTGKNIHPYETRNARKYRRLSCRTNHKLFSILFQGPKVWNSLPNDIREKPSLTSFKTNLKTILLHDLEQTCLLHLKIHGAKSDVTGYDTSRYVLVFLKILVSSGVKAHTRPVSCWCRDPYSS